MIASPYPDIEIPTTTLYEELFANLSDEDLDRIALIDGATDAVTTYRTLRDQVDAFAGSLAARGVGIGDVIALLCPNVPAYAVAFHGIVRAGAAVTTLNSLYTADEIQKQLADANASWLVTVSPLVANGRVAAEARGIPTERIVVLDGAEGHLDLHTLLAEQLPAPAVSFDPAEHVAVLPYSSGTSGTPKGVMLSHRNLVANIAQSRIAIDLHAEDRVLAVLPFFHIYGLTVLLNLALRQRATLVTMPKFELAEFLRITEELRCTFLFVAPPIVVALAKHPLVAKRDLSTVRTLFSGAAPLDGATAAAAGNRIGARVLQGYGMTELSPVSHAAPPDGSASFNSVGRSLPNIVCRLVDTETGRDVPAPSPGGKSVPGELWIKGPNVMLGYLGRPEATAETIDSEGFLHTGDVAIYHADHTFTIVDRVKELIKYKGYQVAPAELEAILLASPGILDAAVIGVLNADGEEIPKAFVVIDPDHPVTAEQVQEFVADRVAPYKRIRQVVFIDEIPKSASGKILRRQLSDG